MVRLSMTLIVCLFVQLSFVSSQLILWYVQLIFERICTFCIDRAYLGI
jgi:hypothetical protein